jgi:hypothetical protein
MHPPILVVFLGIGISLVSWIWFRHPGQPFWFSGPVWQASKYVTPAGVRLWIAGSVVSGVGVLWLLGSWLIGS